MRHLAIGFVIGTLSLPLFAQPTPRRTMGPSSGAETAERAIQQASEQLVMIKKICERDVAVLGHVRAADKALMDSMQPDNAIQKAYEEIDAAKMAEALVPPPDFVVTQGLGAAGQEIDNARRSPASADFSHLRTVVRERALVPASRVAVRNAMRLNEEARAWLRVQTMVAGYVQTLTDIASASLRASEQE